MGALKVVVDCIGQFLWHIAPALVGVAFGGFLVNRFFVRKANLAVLVERVCDSLAELREDTAEYWSVDAPTAKKEAAVHAVLEAKIKGHALSVSAFVSAIEAKYHKLPVEHRLLVMQLIDAATGGDFETKNRKADKTRYTRILRCASRLMTALQQLKV